MKTHRNYLQNRNYPMDDLSCCAHPERKLPRPLFSRMIVDVQISGYPPLQLGNTLSDLIRSSCGLLFSKGILLFAVLLCVLRL